LNSAPEMGIHDVPQPARRARFCLRITRIKRILKQRNRWPEMPGVNVAGKGESARVPLRVFVASCEPCFYVSHEGTKPRRFRFKVVAKEQECERLLTRRPKARQRNGFGVASHRRDAFRLGIRGTTAQRRPSQQKKLLGSAMPESVCGSPTHMWMTPPLLVGSIRVTRRQKMAGRAGCHSAGSCDMSRPPSPRLCLAKPRLWTRLKF
jgi:hypothetical protein